MAKGMTALTKRLKADKKLFTWNTFIYPAKPRDAHIAHKYECITKTQIQGGLKSSLPAGAKRATTAYSLPGRIV